MILKYNLILFAYIWSNYEIDSKSCSNQIIKIPIKNWIIKALKFKALQQKIFSQSSYLITKFL